MNYLISTYKPIPMAILASSITLLSILLIIFGIIIIRVLKTHLNKISDKSTNKTNTNKDKYKVDLASNYCIHQVNVSTVEEK